MPVHSWQTSPIVPCVEPMVPVHVYDTVVLGSLLKKWSEAVLAEVL